MSVEQAGNRVRIVINGDLHPTDARVAATEIERIAGVIEASVSQADSRAIAADVTSALDSVPDPMGYIDRPKLIKAFSDYLAAAGYKKPTGKP